MGSGFRDPVVDRINAWFQQDSWRGCTHLHRRGVGVVDEHASGAIERRYPRSYSVTSSTVRDGNVAVTQAAMSAGSRLPLVDLPIGPRILPSMK
jgi:hypothetical protein